MSRRLLVATAAVVAFAVAFAAVAFGGARLRSSRPVPDTTWALGGLDGSNLFRSNDGTTILHGNATNATFHGKRYVETGQDGNFEFEHSTAGPNTLFDARSLDGSRTPIQIGLTDGQDVTPLLVPIAKKSTVDGQSWQVGDATPTGIDLHGRLRLNGIVIYPLVRNGHARLYAILPNGTVQRLVPVGNR